MIAAAHALEGGFATPVFDAQETFRALMDAMARPGSIHRLGDLVTPPAPLTTAAAAIACTLADADTSLWPDSEIAASGHAVEWLAFHTGAPIVVSPSRATIGLVADPASMPPFDRFAVGTQEFPDRSTTIVIQVKSLDRGDPLIFVGPGIKDRISIAPLGLPTDFSGQWTANRALFPRGIDLVLVAADAFVCLPRSARLVGQEN